MVENYWVFRNFKLFYKGGKYKINKNRYINTLYIIILFIIMIKDLKKDRKQKKDYLKK